jgi:exopolyphosphatase/guanosine-5'-triphosphate,3'-diphosphate pyrophosphatase
MRQSNSHIAAIDVGSNSTHLVIAEVDTLGHIHILETQKEQSLLAASLTKDDCLDAESVTRLSATLKRMNELCASYGAKPRAVATQTLRQARNSAAFCQKVLKRTGVAIDVVTGQEEARLIYLGVQLGLDLGSAATLVLDIGGGSTEIVIGERGEELLSVSLSLGCVRLTKDMLPTGTFGSSDVRALQRAVAVRLRGVAEDVRRIGFERCVCSSGTVKAVKQLALGLAKSESPASFHGASLSADEIHLAFNALIKASTPKERRSLPGVDADRADILLAGTAILKEFSDQHGITEWTLSGYALREGILVDVLSRSGDWLRGDPDDVRWRSTRALGRRFMIDEAHAHRVTTLALRLYDGLALADKDEGRWREYLRCASHLHEAGRFLSYSAYHKHSYYLIRNASMPGFGLREQELIARMVRYHRKRSPRLTDEEWSGFSDLECRQIVLCASVLRLAVVLDKSRRGVLVDVGCSVDEGRMVLVAGYRGKEEPQSELFHFELEREAIQSALRRKLELQLRKL